MDSRALNTSIEGHDDEVSFVEGGHVIKMSVQVDEEQALLLDLETGNDANAKEIGDNNNQSEGHVSDEGEICSDEDTDSPLVQSGHGNAVAKVAGQGRSSVPDVNKNRSKSVEDSQQQIRKIDMEMKKRMEELHQLMTTKGLKQSANMLEKCTRSCR